MKIRESCLQTGNFIYKPGISLTKQDFHLQRGSLGLQRGFSGYYLPDKYLFEVLSKKTSSLMWQKYEIVKVSQFVDYSEAQLEEIISLYPKLSRIVKTRLQEH